jgi:hypothetical protein
MKGGRLRMSLLRRKKKTAEKKVFPAVSISTKCSELGC